jgi:peptidoglycan/LPS O-acetylase OafA/YrhL
VENVPEVSRFLLSGDEAGTAPTDRAFRPDVEGLRALAILLVVAFHVGIRRIPGGNAGVDVFFVISGFVITGVLMRDRQLTGGIGFIKFYARRARRILPMAILVIVVSFLAMHVLIAPSAWPLLDGDARWSSLFAADFRFAAALPMIFTQRVQSPFEQYWSLAVEEQFYIVYPALFVTAVFVLRWLTFRTALTILLTVVVVGSLWVSTSSSHVGQLGAYYLPFARAWELAVGALVAVGTETWKRIPHHVGAALSWIGVVGILWSGAEISLRFAYPGAIAIVPVASSALVIIGGSSAPPWGAESLLGLAAVRSIGRVSYSWYLWHWPFLAIAAERTHASVVASPLGKNLGLVALALGLSYLSYHFVERPVRHARWLIERPGFSIAGAVLLVGSCAAFTYLW